MKLPQHVIISGYKWNIKRGSRKNGGSFDCDRREIYIGRFDDDVTLEILLHEIIEAVLTVRDLRYRTCSDESDSGNIAFVFNHSQFEQAIKDIRYAIEPIIKRG